MTKNDSAVWAKCLSYAAYCCTLCVTCIGGAGYAVFVLDRDPLWILAGVIICSFGYKPAQWAALAK
jgi:hypothetical protein